MHDPDAGGASGDLVRFRHEFYRCLTRRADALFELAEAVLCAEGPVRSLPELSLLAEHRRGHGGLYAGLAHGRIDVDRLRDAILAGPLPQAADGRLVLAVDITCWLRPEAHTAPERVMCHAYGRNRNQHLAIPGWPYSVVVALESGRSSWTAPVDIQRLAPGVDAATVTAHQLRRVVTGLITHGHWQPGDREILIVADAGYDGPRLAFQLADLPVAVLVRMRSDRVLRRSAPPHTPHTVGRPRRHGSEFVFGDPATWGQPDVAIDADTRLYGPAIVRAWNRLHPRLTHRTAWTTHVGHLPILEGTVVRLQVDRLPSGAIPKPVWLWYSRVDLDIEMVDLLWQAFLRRFDIEHTFRLFKQTLGWTRPKLRTPEQADRWGWLMLAAYTQLRLARRLAADLRRPWEKPAPPGRLTPARVRRGFRHLRAQAGCPASAPKPTRAGPGRPTGRRNDRPATRHDVHVITSTTSKKYKSSTPRPRRTG
ncbi:NF041680 family putative transposase [Amycolatopsis thermoflava]|uniref:NF041680 family putative transposase n=1 Tax=Amycolatopsis thermoflava TaxID=84480 RepID=UPI001E51D088|nr:NF041680 family putative transposase [Amycolatopsis thermoflava]